VHEHGVVLATNLTKSTMLRAMRSPAAICTGSCRDEKRDGSPQAFARVWSIKGSLFRRLQGAMKGVSTLVSEGAERRPFTA
jgi:hypothetical protein